MQILEQKDFLIDPYENSLFDFPVHINQYYRDTEDLYIGALKLDVKDEKVIKNYYKGFYKEELITNHYACKRGNDKGNFWHEMIGDSEVRNGILLTEIWYSDSMEKKIIGYFVSNAIDVSLVPYGFVEEIKLEEIQSFYSRLKASKTMFKLKVLLGLEEGSVSQDELKSWLNEPIKDYLEDIQKLIQEEN